MPEPADHRKAVQAVIRAAAEPELAPHFVLALNRTRIRGALACDWIGAPAGQVACQQVGYRVAIHFVGEDAIEVMIQSR